VRVIKVMALVAGLVVGVAGCGTVGEPVSRAVVSTTCTEDSACWQCEMMGNQVCGTGAAAPTTTVEGNTCPEMSECWGKQEWPRHEGPIDREEADRQVAGQVADLAVETGPQWRCWWEPNAEQPGGYEVICAAP
jgi:hypothetical protein